MGDSVIMCDETIEAKLHDEETKTIRTNFNEKKVTQISIFYLHLH